MELHNQEAEEIILGSIIMINQRLTNLEFLDEKHFYFDDHKQIWREILRLIIEDKPADMTTLKNFFSNGNVGGLDKLKTLGLLASGVISIKDYANFLVELWQKREFKLALEMAIGDLGSDFMVVKDKLDAKVAELSFELSKEPQTINQLVNSVIDNPAGELLYFGFSNLDELLAGVDRGDLIILGGRPSSGKTTFCLNLARNVSEKFGVLFFSIEVKGSSIARKFLTEIASVNPYRLKQGKLNQCETAAVVSYRNKTADYKLLIDDGSGMTLSKMRARIKRMQRKYDVGMVCIDYLQLITPETKEFSREQQISKISEGLKKIAKDFNIVVVALSQLSRAGDSRDNKRPILSDLRDSGAIEQNADIVMFVHRDEYFLEREKEPEHSKHYQEWKQLYEASKGKADVIVAKYRDGNVGDVRFDFNPLYSRFVPTIN